MYRSIDDFIRTCAAIAGDPEAKYSYVKLLRITTSILGDFQFGILPNIITVDRVVQTNGTILLPNDTIQPLYVAQIKNCGGNRILFPFGARYNQVNPDREHFLDCDVTEIGDDVCPCEFYNYSGSLSAFYLWDRFYLENYGKTTSRYFGYYYFDQSNGRLDMYGANVGDLFLVSVKTVNEEYKVFPREAEEVIRSRVLQMYYESSDLNKSQYYFDQFRRHIRNYKHNKQDHFGPDEWVDAIRKEQSNAVR